MFSSKEVSIIRNLVLYLGEYVQDYREQNAEGHSGKEPAKYEYCRNTEL